METHAIHELKLRDDGEGRILPAEIRRYPFSLITTRLAMQIAKSFFFRSVTFGQ